MLTSVAPPLPQHTRLGSELPPMAFAHPTRFTPELVTPVRNIAWQKPDGGLWLSPLRETGETVWMEFIRTQYPQFYKRPPLPTLVALAPTAPFLTISSLASLQEILSEFLYLPTDDFIGTSPVLDFEKLAEHYAGLYLTERGQWETHRPGPGLPHLYGWDLESLLVFDPAVVTPCS